MDASGANLHQKLERMSCLCAACYLPWTPYIVCDILFQGWLISKFSSSTCIDSYISLRHGIDDAHLFKALFVFVVSSQHNFLTWTSILLLTPELFISSFIFQVLIPHWWVTEAAKRASWNVWRKMIKKKEEEESQRESTWIQLKYQPAPPRKALWEPIERSPSCWNPFPMNSWHDRCTKIKLSTVKNISPNWVEVWCPLP